MFVGSDFVIPGTRSASPASPNGGMAVVTTQGLRPATRVPLLRPELGERVPRGGLGLSLRTAPEYELLGWMAKVQPSLFIRDRNKSHDIYAHTLGLFVGLSN